MSVQTQVTWIYPTNPDTVTALDAQAQILMDQGKEIAEPTREGTQTQVTVTRTWIDLATAESWIATVQPYNPASAVIVG